MAVTRSSISFITRAKDGGGSKSLLRPQGAFFPGRKSTRALRLQDRIGGSRCVFRQRSLGVLVDADLRAACQMSTLEASMIAAVVESGNQTPARAVFSHRARSARSTEVRDLASFTKVHPPCTATQRLIEPCATVSGLPMISKHPQSTRWFCPCDRHCRRSESSLSRSGQDR